MTIAIFPARMNPPHLGHVLTLLRYKKEYEKIIVAIGYNTYNGAKNPVMSISQVIDTLKKVFDHFPNYEIISQPPDLPFSQRTTYDDLPKFDIVLTGNRAVYNNAIKTGLTAKIVERTPFYSSSAIREGEYLCPEYQTCKGFPNDCAWCG